MSLSICQVLLGAFIADFGLLPILPATYFTSRLALVTSCNACVVFLMIASVFSFHHLDLGLALKRETYVFVLELSAKLICSSVVIDYYSCYITYFSFQIPFILWKLLLGEFFLDNHHNIQIYQDPY